MALNKNKIVALAQKYTAKGQFDRAIAEYQKLLKVEPNDIRTSLKIGDLYTRKGSRTEATETYLKVAKQYTKNGFHLKAVAVYKQILKIDPALVDVHQLLAGAYLELGLSSEALIQLEQLADIYQRTGRADQLSGALRKMTEIDPSNIATRLRLAELFSKQERVEDAVEQFSYACDDLRRQGRVDDFLKVAERLLYHEPSRIELGREVAGIYIDQSKYKNALGKLQTCFVKDPRDLETLELLARAFEGLGQPEKSVSVYNEMVLLLHERGETARVREALGRILEMDPDNESALAGLAELDGGPRASREPQRAQPNAFDSLPSPGVAVAEDFGEQAEALQEELTEEEIEARVVEIMSETEVLIKYGLTDRAIDHIGQIFELDSCNIDARERLRDLLVQVGRRDEAIEQLFFLVEFFEESQPEGSVYYLHEILKIDATNERAILKIRDLGGVMPDFVQAEVVEGALSSAPRPESPVLVGDGDALLLSEEDALASPEDSTRPRVVVPSELEEEPRPSMMPGWEPTIEDIPYVAPENVLTEQDLLGGDQEPLEFDVEVDSGLHGASGDEPDSFAGGAAEAAVVVEKDEASFEDLSLDEDAGPESAPAPEVETENAQPSVDEDTQDFGGLDLPEEDGDDLLLEDDDGPVQAPRLSRAPSDVSPVRPPGGSTSIFPARTAPPPPPAATASIQPSSPMDHVSELPEDVVEELEEVDFFIEQELFDEADVILAGLEEEYGAHPEVSGRVARLVGVKDGRDGAAGDPKPLSTPPPGKAGSAERLTFDADSLAEDLNLNDITHDSEVEDLEEVFNRFKVGVQEQVEKTDYSTHYDLGLAYREMGLFADAIAEFEIAVGDPERRAEIKMMIGTCQVALERFEDAVTSFMSGLVVDSISDQQKCGLMYELGKTFQMMGRREEAVDIFDEIESIEPGFADVSIRIEALRGGTVSSLKRGLFD